ncbi:MAG: hypothetical protein IPH12_21550 [Saprospirales bacterium]|nr:hypothetical protein [Saprospirales bacterium]MBK8920580.1 hypothetical protein [Saprospirales bacterium]
MFTRIHRSSLLLAVLALCLLLTACHTAQKFVESGDYDGAISYCVQKLRGKKKKNTDLVKGLETAFSKAQARDLNTAHHLAADGRAEYWERINAIHRQIHLRQNKIAPLLPLVSKDGYRARFEFVDIGKLERESREKAAEYLYTQAESMLQRAEQGDRLAARQAYQTLRDLESRYYKHYKNKEQMLLDARNLGTTHILFEVKNQSEQVLPRNFIDQIMAIGAQDLDSEWKAFHFRPDPAVPVDYRAVFHIRQVDISPERISERIYVDEKEIQDGWDYVLDERGNVKKDTAGNDIKTPRIVCIRADVLETLQSKAARLTGALDIFDGAYNNRIDTRALGAEILFEHYASTFQGDPRALSADSKRRIGSRPAPFPRDEDMLLQAADRLKPDIREELRQNRGIL